MPQRKLAFAVHTDAGLRSRSWNVTTAANASDIYVRKESAGGVLHVSFHRSGWYHVKIENDPLIQWTKAVELAPGTTRLMEITVPTSACTISEPEADTRLFTAGTTPDASRFDLFLQVRPDRNAWPGKHSMGTELVGRLPLPNGQTVTVVHHHEPFKAGEVSIPIESPEQRAELLASLAAGTLNLVLWGLQPDGCIAAMDATPPAATQQALARGKSEQTTE